MTLDISDAQLRMTARKLLRAEYVTDVQDIAEVLVTRIRGGDFDRAYWSVEPAIDLEVRKHRRVSDPQLALETITYSENRQAIEADFLRGWSEERGGPWEALTSRFEGVSEVDGRITLPPWEVIAEYAFARDVRERIYERLGDAPERYIATRLGLDYLD